MIDENQDANIEPETSPEETQIEESSTSEVEEKQVEETPFHEHPRFKEVISEKNEYKQQVADLTNKLTEIASTQNKPAQDQDNPYDGMTAEEASFWKNSDSRTKGLIDKAVQSALGRAQEDYRKEIQGYQGMVGNVIAQNFLEKHPDVTKGSLEMEKIVTTAQDLAGKGIDLTRALEMSYKDVMFDKNAQKQVEKVKKQKEQKTQEKLKANVETTGVSSEALRPEDMSVEKVFDNAAKDLGVTI